MATRAFSDGSSWTSAVACSLAIFEAPIPGVNSFYLLRQRFTCYKESFTPLALNTAHPDDSSYKLAEESPLEDMGCGRVEWTRLYAQTPSQHIELSTTNYNFIGFWGTRPSNIGDPSLATGRDRTQHFVMVKHQFDYYLVDGSIITTLYGIPVIEETFYRGATPIGTSPIFVDYLWDNPPYANTSNPSTGTYKGWMAADAASASSFSICVQGSRLERWYGNIFRRETLFVKAI